MFCNAAAVVTVQSAAKMHSDGVTCAHEAPRLCCAGPPHAVSETAPAVAAARDAPACPRDEHFLAQPTRTIDVQEPDAAASETADAASQAERDREIAAMLADVRALRAAQAAFAIKQKRDFAELRATHAANFAALEATFTADFADLRDCVRDYCAWVGISAEAVGIRPRDAPPPRAALVEPHQQHSSSMTPEQRAARFAVAHTSQRRERAD